MCNYRDSSDAKLLWSVKTTNQCYVCRLKDYAITAVHSARAKVYDNIIPQLPIYAVRTHLDYTVCDTTAEAANKLNK